MYTTSIATTRLLWSNAPTGYEVPQRTLADGSTLTPLDEDAVAEAAAELAAASVDCVVVCFLHSYAFPDDENRAAEILRRNLPSQIAVLTSSSVYPEFREYERFSTAVLNGALLTVVSSYLDRLISGVEKLGIPSEIKIGQSSGGLMSVRMAREFPVRACLSGPAAGVQGAARRTANESNLITMDVGGTSADVSLLLGGKPTEVSERELAGFPIRLPALDVVAVGAGGGSIARRGRDGLLKVGPQSAGAVPGPACYGLGGKNPTLTDANVVLGRLNNRALLAGRMPIESKLAEEATRSIAQALRATIEETALGIVQVACATMVKAIRSVSIERGHDPREFALFAYGGAGSLARYGCRARSRNSKGDRSIEPGHLVRRGRARRKPCLGLRRHAVRKTGAFEHFDPPISDLQLGSSIGELVPAGANSKA